MIHLLLAALLAGAPAVVHAQDEEPAVEQPKKKRKKKAPEKPSKYRFKNVDPTESQYRFDAETRQPVRKKKKAVKKQSTPEDEIDGIVPAEDCGLDAEVCSAPKNG